MIIKLLFPGEIYRLFAGFTNVSQELVVYSLFFLSLCSFNQKNNIMKKLSILLIAIMMGISLYAQEENKPQQEYKSLFGGTEITHGGYGGLSINYSRIDGEDAVLVGARGAWIINHGIAIGIAGYGFANELKYKRTFKGYSGKYILAGGYGGLLIEPIIGAFKPVHISIPILIGAGGVTYMDEYWDIYDDPFYYKPYYEYSDAFFVFEPGVEIELNMVKFMRLAFGGYYRFTFGIDLEGSKSNMMNGFSTGITLKFGKF